VVGTAAAVWLSGPAARAGTHVVAPGETLSGIAARYATTVARLVSMNDIRDPHMIVAGQRLRVPARALVASVHVVRPGDTLSAIARRYGTTVEVLARANHIRDENLIVVGDKLRIPQGSAHSAGARVTGVESSLEEHAAEHGIDESLVKAVAWHESRWKPDAVSDAGAIGVMQVMPETAEFVNESLGGRSLDLGARDDNVELGVRYLDHLLEEMPSEGKALAAYQSGPGAVDEKLDDYQRDYVREVESLKPKF
jgi:N-acetylmuramoyl-L-alanine amidase